MAGRKIDKVIPEKEVHVDSNEHNFSAPFAVVNAAIYQHTGLLSIKYKLEIKRDDTTGASSYFIRWPNNAHIIIFVMGV